MNNNSTTSSKKQLLFRVIGFFFLILAFVLAFYGLVIGLAVRQGNNRRLETQLTTQASQLARQMELAQEDYRKGSYQLVLTRLDWVLENDPNYPGAAALYQQTQAELARQNATPTPALTPASTATITPIPTPIVNSAQELAEIRQLVQTETWQEAIARLVAFQTQFPNDNREETDRLLYEAYIGLGLETIYDEQVELGIYYLDQAETLGNLPIEVQDQRVWAKLYVTGIVFYQVNWDVSVYYFRQLCAAAPFFHDACGKLYTSLLAFGDQFAAALDWCPAENAYREAIPFGNTQTLRDKLNTSVEGCLQATPTPSAPITGTLPITETAPFTDTIPAE